MATVEYIPFRGRIQMLDGKELQYLREFQGQGETLEQALERICIEADEEGLEQQQRRRTHNPNTIDYYLTIEH